MRWVDTTESGMQNRVTLATKDESNNIKMNLAPATCVQTITILPAEAKIEELTLLEYKSQRFRRRDAVHLPGRITNSLCPISCLVTPVNKAIFHQYKTYSSRLPFGSSEERGCTFGSVPALLVSLQLF